ncbi:MAG: hypothetical protein QM784_15315 [Polyangiaceae bacterium]
MKVFVGQAKVVGPISRYFGRFNFLELSAEPGRCPRPAILKQWREAAPKGFAFSVRMAPSVGAFDSDAEKAIAFGLRAADVLQAEMAARPDPGNPWSEPTQPYAAQAIVRTPFGDRTKRRLGTSRDLGRRRNFAAHFGS